MTFWHWLWLLNQHTAGCTARTESTRSHVIYGGSCVQAWPISLHIPGVAWIFN
jgi:hypothetical protein